MRPTSGYRIPTRPDHDGLDMNVGQDQNKQTISGIPIYPAKPGTVTYARYNYTDSQRWTPNPNLPGKYLDTSNYVIIDHGNGYKTHYVHLMYENIPTVTIGQQVTTTTVLGRMGNTGQSSGPHLHFGVFLNGVDKDPNLYINATGGDALDWQRPKWCRAVGEGDVSRELEDWANDGKTADEITINFKKAGWPFKGGDFKSIEGFNPSVNTITNMSEVQYGLNGANDNSVFKVYGVAPYKGMNIRIKVWDGDNVVEEKVEQLQGAKWIARKSQFGYADTNVNSEQDNNSDSGRIDFNVTEKWSSDPSFFQDTKVTHQDKMWIDSKLKHDTGCNGGTCRIPDVFTYWNNEKSSNRVRIESDLKRIPDHIGTGSSIEKIFTLTGDRSDTSKFTKADDLNKRLIKLNAVGNINPNNNTWILSHGWNGSLKTMKEIGQKIKNDSATENDNVFVLDWREASHSGGNTLDVCISSTWTKPLAEQVKLKLNDWGFSDKSKLRLVGHSMGTILNTEIGKQFGEAELSMSLDPPSDPCSTYNFEGYNVLGTSVYDSGNYKGELKVSSINARSFVGANSVAGSQEHNRTADLSFRVNFGTATTNGAEHGWVQETWSLMLQSDRLQGDTLGAKDMSKHENWEKDRDNWQNNYGVLFTKSKNPVFDKSMKSGDVDRLEYKINGEVRRLDKN